MPPPPRTDLQVLASEIRRYPGVTRKRRLGALTEHFQAASDARVVADFGEDCAVLDLPGMKDDFLLLALDAIVPELLHRSPRAAGYSSVLVNVLDVVAMAGHPIAAVDFLGSTGRAFESEVASGMAEAARHFAVPIVGGHLHPDDPSPSLAVAILGRVSKRHCTFSHTAREGDTLLVAVDLDGRRLKDYPMAWSPLRTKSRRAVERRLNAVRGAGAEGLVGACKDASNPGIVGTLGMMLEASGVGGFLDVEKLPKPPGITLRDWVLMFQGCGFVYAARPHKAQRLAHALEGGGLTCAAVGRAFKARRLDLVQGKEAVRVFDLRRGGVTGIPPVQS